MSINRFFQDTLGANLKNPRWSWGAIAPVSNRVFLRVWKDQIQPDGNGEKVQIYWKHTVRNSPGYAERLAHLKAIENGALGIGIVCIARDPHTSEARQIADFQRSPLLELGYFTEDDKGIYAHIAGLIPISELTRPLTAHSTLSKDLKAIFATKAVDSTTKETLVDARVGQGAFRSAVLQLWNQRCSVTGSITQDAIRASHIKPWRTSTNEERLDPMNGLPLVASLDALFDGGLISFEDSGRILISSELSRHEQTIYGLNGAELTKKPSSKTADYLQYHRTKLYRK
jgi:putative restriction endonuclease